MLKALRRPFDCTLAAASLTQFCCKVPAAINYQQKYSKSRKQTMHALCNPDCTRLCYQGWDRTPSVASLLRFCRKVSAARNWGNSYAILLYAGVHHEPLEIALHLRQVCTVSAVKFLPRATDEILTQFCCTRVSITSLLRSHSICHKSAPFLP